MRSFLSTSAYILLVVGLGCFFLVEACQSAKDAKEKIPADFTAAYSLYLIYEDGTMGFLLTDSLWQRSFEIPVPYPQFSREFIQKGGLFYHVNPISDHLIQFKLSPTGFQALDSLPIVNDNIENFVWKNDSDTLLLLNVQKGLRDTCWFYEIDTRSFSLLRKEQMPIPSAVEDFNLLSIGLSSFEKNELWVAYAYSKIVGQHDYTTSDTMYYATFDAHTLSEKKLQKDNRSTYPGGINTVQTYEARLQNGDYYFMSCPGIALGNSPSKPTAILRKLNGSDEVDAHYMLNVSDSIGNHAYGLWHLEGHNVIIRSERKDKFTDFSNHHAVFQFDYYLADLLKGSFEKLDLPLDKGTRKENVLVRNGKAYIGIDDEQQRHQVWQYDPTTGKTQPIFTSTAATSYILRLDWLDNDF